MLYAYVHEMSVLSVKDCEEKGIVTFKKQMVAEMKGRVNKLVSEGNFEGSQKLFANTHVTRPVINERR